MIRSRFVPLAILGLVLAACGGTQQTSGPAGPTGAAATPGLVATNVPPAGADATPGTSLSACELVAPGDIEAALDLDAGAVADGTLTQKGTVLDAAANECRYENGDWGGLVVNVTPTDGVNTFNAVLKAFGDDAEQIQVGDGALWFQAQKRGYFLKGSVMVLLQFTHIAQSVPSFRDPTVDVGTAAVAKI